MLTFLNGEIIKEEDAKISIGDLSYQFGYGLFESIRCEGGIPLFFEAHYKRLAHSAKEIGMSFPVDLKEIEGWIKETLKANKLQDARIKVIISKRPEEKFNVLIIPAKLEPLPESYSLTTKRLIRDPKAISFCHKTTSRGDSYFAYKEAIENGFNDVLYLNEKNELLECSRSNIFLIMEDKIITPHLDLGILWGTTREKVIEILKREGATVQEKNVHSLYLNKAKGVFTTSAIISVMPVSKVKTEDKEYTFLTSITPLQNAYEAEIQDYLRKNIGIGISF